VCFSLIRESLQCNRRHLTHVPKIRSCVRTHVAVFQQVKLVMAIMTVEIGLMNRTVVSDSYVCLFTL